MGAGRWRIVRQLLTESWLLALGGALAGVAVGYVAVLLWRQIPIEDDVAIELLFQIDRRVLFVNLAIAVASVFAFGLAPALRTSRANLAGALRGTGGAQAARSSWGRGTLVVVQVALSTVFIAITAFIYASFLEQMAAGPGIRTERVLTMTFDTELARHGADEARQFFARLADRAREVPGVEAAALASFNPMSGLSR
jgi:ABC-type Mn2+/Zn2+ transport system permease subunit